MAVGSPSGTESRSSSASSASSSASSTPTSSLKHPLPPRPLRSPSPTPAPATPATPVQPTIILMTPTPPPSAAREQAPAVQLPAPKPASASGPFTNTTPNPLLTSNVYINGLPPHYKDEELYALASQFGSVLSCRTFTRQLSDMPTGYGFVLFETIEAAQQCINVLRSHHNLHPHFAKQPHKIPGVASYKMDQVQGVDIYIEGLPMHVDLQTLRALLAPHTVLSSRFFADTRVQPPLLVAFIRLPSRAAADDVHDRLHGRTVRGYSARLTVTLDADSNGTPPPDPGQSRISGLPADPFTDTARTLENNKAPDYALNPHAPYTPLISQNPYERPVEELLQTLRELNMQPVRAQPQPLQPLSATLHELQMQLENLRPLLAAYHTNSPAYNPGSPASYTTSPTAPAFSPRTHQARLRSVSQPHEHLLPTRTGNAGGHSRTHTTGHPHSLMGVGLGVGFPPQRQVSNPEHVMNASMNAQIPERPWGSATATANRG